PTLVPVGEAAFHEPTRSGPASFFFSSIAKPPLGNATGAHSGACASTLGVHITAWENLGTRGGTPFPALWVAPNGGRLRLAPSPACSEGTAKAPGIRDGRMAEQSRKPDGTRAGVASGQCRCQNTPLPVHRSPSSP